MTKKILVVLGATGQQGSSVVNAVLADAELKERYSIRAITRDRSKPEAEKLGKNEAVEVVEADVNDLESLKRAFKDADTVFALTVSVYDGNTFDTEVAQGRAIADAAVAAKVPHIIFSTLPSITKISDGKLKKGSHFDSKEVTEQYIRKQPIKSAFVAPGGFMSNFEGPWMPQPVEDGKYSIFNFIDPDTAIPMIDVVADLGKWVAAILADFSKYEGKVLNCAVGTYSFQDLAEAIGKATGKKVIYTKLPESEWRAFLPPTMADCMVDMFHLFEDYGYYGKDTPESVKWAAAQARGKLTTFEQYLKAHPLSLK